MSYFLISHDGCSRVCKLSHKVSVDEIGSLSSNGNENVTWK